MVLVPVFRNFVEQIVISKKNSTFSWKLADKMKHDLNFPFGQSFVAKIAKSSLLLFMSVSCLPITKLVVSDL